MAWRGTAGQGLAWQGEAGQGKARQGRAREMTELDFLLSRFPADFKGSFMAIGEWRGVSGALAGAGWSGTVVTAPGGYASFVRKYDSIRYVEAPLGTDPHFMRTLEGCHVRLVTLREIVDQFGGGYSIVLVNWPMLSRQLWFSETLQEMMPTVHVLPEDGHNEAVVKRAEQRGYTCERNYDGLLILVHHKTFSERGV